VFNYLADAWALGEAARTLLLPEDVDYMFGMGSSRHEAAWVAALLIKFEVATGDDLTSFDRVMTRRELYGLLYGWLKQRGVLREQTGRVMTVADRRLTLREKGKDTPVSLPKGIAVYHGVNERYTEARLVPIQIGDRGIVVMHGRQPVAFAVIANHDGGGFDQRSAWSSWVRSYTEDELVKSISRRNPIKKLEGIHIKGRDASGRVTGLEVKADSGTFTLEGLPIRWSLGVPDNLFVFETRRQRNGTLRYTFLGKGWGHGVGMCQNGAFGMGIRGFKAEEILKHYYTGVEIEKYR
jgi:stage II sporulation protein D